MSVAREDPVLQRLLEELMKTGSVDSRLAYVLGRYVELKRVYDELAWHLRAGFARGGISGAQVVIGFVNADLLVGVFSLILALGSVVFTMLFPVYAVHATAIAIVSFAAAAAGIIHFALRVKKKLTLEIT